MPELIVCSIDNPSDAYSLVTTDFTLAAVAVAILGGGKYGLSSDNERSPVLFGWDEWLKEQGIDDLSAYVDAHLEHMIEILDSVMIGDVNTRKDAESMLAKLPEDKRAEWLAERHDRRRTSMNDIGERAAYIARRYRNRLAAPVLAAERIKQEKEPNTHA